MKSKTRRVKTIYDCQADNDDELTFTEGEVIIVTGEEDQEWWVRTTGGGRAIYSDSGLVLVSSHLKGFIRSRGWLESQVFNVLEMDLSSYESLVSHGSRCEQRLKDLRTVL